MGCPVLCRMVIAYQSKGWIRIYLLWKIRNFDQGGVWYWSSEVRCKNWVQKRKVIRMSGFGVLLLSVWTWRDAWVQGNVYCGAGFVFGKGGRLAFGARGTKLVCCRGHIRWAELFSSRLDISSPLACENWMCALGKNSDALFWFTCGANGCGGTGCWMGGEEAPGKCREGGWSAVP